MNNIKQMLRKYISLIYKDNQIANNYINYIKVHEESEVRAQCFPISYRSSRSKQEINK